MRPISSSARRLLGKTSIHATNHPLNSHIISSIKAGAAHIAFSAADRVAVRNFYTAALTAGARPHGSPATRDSENGVFNAAVLDFDGNSIEVMYRENVDPMEDARSATGASRVLTWRKSVSGSLRDDESVISGSSVKTATRTVVPYQAPQSAGPGSVYAPSVKAESVARSQAPSVARTQSAPVVPKSSKEELNPELMADAGARKIIGTLIGAAAGAAVAYAMVKSERDSAKEEVAAVTASQAASQRAPSVREPSQKAPSVAPSQYQQSEYPLTPSQVQQMIQYERAPSQRSYSETESMYSAPRERMAIEAAPPRSSHAPTLVSALQSGVNTIRQVHRNFSETESMYSSVDSRDRYSRALENTPQTAKSYLNPTCVSVAQTSASKREDVEYIPASSVGPRSTYSRKSSAPSVMSEMPKSSRAPSQAPSKAPSQSASKSGSRAPSLISSFNPNDDAKSQASERRSSAPSVHSSRSAANKLDAVDENAERHSSAGSVRSHHSSKSKAKSLISSFAPDQDRDDYPPTPERRSSAASVHSTRSKAKSSASTVKQEGSKAPSMLGSMLGRNRAADTSDNEPSSDLDTVAPSDSISNAGTSRSSQRRSSRANDGDDSKSTHSSRSKHSKHSSSSRHSSSSKSRHDGDDDRKSHVSSRSHKSSSSRRSEREKEDDVVRPSNISEPSDASTVKPYKPGKERKDSVVSLPTRKLEGSIASHGPKRSVVSFAG